MVASLYKWLFISIFTLVHPFYISVTEIKHNAAEKTIQISCKMFLDDTEKALKKQLNTIVELTKPADPKKAQQLVSDYIKKNLKIKINGKPIIFECIGYEIEGAAVWSYFEVKNINTVQSITLSNTLLYDLYNEQISIVHAQVGNIKKSLRVNNPESNMSFEF